MSLKEVVVKKIRLSLIRACLLCHSPCKKTRAQLISYCVYHQVSKLQLLPCPPIICDGQEGNAIRSNAVVKVTVEHHLIE